MIVFATWFLLLLQEDVQREYERRAAALRDSDAPGHYALGLWCESRNLPDSARKEFEKTLAAKPGHEEARAKLGYRKIEGHWIPREIQEAVRTGLRFPSDEVTGPLRARGPHHARVIDVFWDRDRWAVALARIQERTGLFTGALEVEVKFADLGKVPAMGEGVRGKGTVWLDLDKLAEYERSIDEFAKRAASGGIVAVPPAKTAAIITHELTHCFQGQSQPSWFLEGMATWCAGDGHFVYYYRHEKQKVQDIETAVEHKFVYARGWAFFEYLDAQHGRARAKEFIVRAIGAEPSAAATEVLKADWISFRREERDWSARWIANFKAK